MLTSVLLAIVGSVAVVLGGLAAVVTAIILATMGLIFSRFFWSIFQDWRENG